MPSEEERSKAGFSPLLLKKRTDLGKAKARHSKYCLAMCMKK